MKTIQIETRDMSQFYYGQKIYVIGLPKYRQGETFFGKCPVCGDAKSIEINGYRFDCPYCRSGRLCDSATNIILRAYIVIEYIINRFEIIGPKYKNAYTGEGLLDNRNLPYVKWYGFCKFGNGYNDTSEREFREYALKEVDIEKIDLKKEEPVGISFLSKAAAERFCKKLHERQKEMLDEFNAEHGTDHQYPFEY